MRKTLAWYKWLRRQPRDDAGFGFGVFESLKWGRVFAKTRGLPPTDPHVQACKVQGGGVEICIAAEPPGPRTPKSDETMARIAERVKRGTIQIDLGLPGVSVEDCLRNYYAKPPPVC